MIVAAPSFDNDVEENDRIIGGEKAQIEDHPYQLQLVLENLTAKTICGASILTETRALTAAHCINSTYHPNRYAVLGGSSIRRPQQPDTRTLTNYTRHHHYGSQGTGEHDFDIAVLHWLSPLVFKSTAQPVKLPLQDAIVPYGINANVTGWGQTSEQDESSLSDHLLIATVQLIPNEKCNQVYNRRIRAHMVCASASQGFCTGDDGGPLVLKGVQIGVASWGTGCAREDYPQVYIRVSHFVDWIKEQLTVQESNI